MRLAAPLTFFLALTAFARDAKDSTHFSLDTTKNLTTIGGTAESTTYRGRHAVHLAPTADTANTDGDMLAIVTGPDFKNGTIELEVAGSPRPGTPADSRGFIGLAFRVQDKDGKGEYFYLRPTNARCEDQLRRNHATQSVSAPDYPWHRLRKENPGVYESYFDLDPVPCTKMKFLASGTARRRYVTQWPQPALGVNHL